MASYFNKGTAQITTGTTSVVVIHGLATTPAASDINIACCSLLAVFHYFDTITSTTFTIRVSATSLTNLDFVWQADTRKS